MDGIIEIHGAKQMFVGDFMQELFSDDLIPGDKVTLIKNTPHLKHRRSQPVIGIVKALHLNTAILHMPNFGLTSKFVPKIPNDNYKIGDRLVIKLHSDGSIDVCASYPDTSEYDAKILTHMYSLTEEAHTNETLNGPNLYTNPDIVNHDDLDTFTIDPATSVDFDDAISVDVENNTIYVHIVDIAGQEISSIGQKNLRERCLTLYLSNEHTEHLLQHEEASETLSLIVGQQRKVITVKVILDDSGLVTAYDIYRSTIVVKRRWNYGEVLDSIAGNTAFSFLADLSNRRSANVTYNLNLPSLRVSSNTNGTVKSIAAENTNDISHALVATAMILANLIVSKHLRSKGIELPNRFHDSLRGFTQQSFISTGDQHVDSFILVKRFSRACYSVDERGHFGLGITDYVHFTSPMRRYADVIVHRLLAGYTYNNLEEEVQRLNHRSLLVRSAQDIYINWKVMRWLKGDLNPKEIWITGVSKSGIMWYMPSLSLNGFIHVTGLKPKQFWKYDDSTLIGQSSNEKMETGQKLSACVISIDTITSTVTLELC